jgi:hypothetical protein
MVYSAKEKKKAQRQKWIKLLQAGENSFNDEMLKELRDWASCSYWSTIES